MGAFTERLMYLAGVEVDCKFLKSPGWPDGHKLGDWACTVCGGKGKVPRFPTLRRKCHKCRDGWFHSANGQDHHCFDCGGRGWLPTDDLPALQAACRQEYIWLNYQPAKDGYWLAYTQRSDGMKFIYGECPTLAEAAVLALSLAWEDSQRQKGETDGRRASNG